MFKQFDYGSMKNKKLYNMPDAPEYDMSNVTVPVTFMYAENDQLTVPDASSSSKRDWRGREWQGHVTLTISPIQCLYYLDSCNIL